MNRIAPDPDRRVAEVIAANTRMFLAEAVRDDAVPGLGEWLFVEEPGGWNAVGVVGFAEHGSLLPNRNAVALGRDDDALRREMPHVVAMMRTTLRVYTLAAIDPEGQIRQALPPAPPRIHRFVHRCDDDQLRSIGPPFDIFRILAASADDDVPLEDLMAAVLRDLQRVHDSHAPDARALLVDAGRVLSRLFRDDHERLQAILRRV